MPDDHETPRFRVRETAEFRVPGPATDGSVLAALDAAKAWHASQATVSTAAPITIGPDPDYPGDLLLSVELTNRTYPGRPRIQAATYRDGDPDDPAARSRTVHPTGDLAGPTRARDV